MSVMIYNNGAWQETSETPKKYVNSAWEDSDGYAYENGVWVEKWSAIPQPFYLITNGVINSSLSVTKTKTGTSTASNWTYSSGSGRLEGKAASGSASDYSSSVELRINAGVDLSKYTKLCIDSQQSTAATSNITRYHGVIYTQGSGGTRPGGQVTGSGAFGNTDRQTHTVTLGSQYDPSLPIILYVRAGRESGSAAVTAYIYNVWLEA